MAVKKTVQTEKKEKKVQTETNVHILRNQLAKLRAEMRVGKVKDVRSASKLRDQIARVLTAERAKELGAQ
ncbi:MAG: 50S ribosomal protein L29 [Candidatus Pacebacteria bacterium]|nr:50S ribosomal protein L29 [Candidatus Paceibacterota bacterium]